MLHPPSSQGAAVAVCKRLVEELKGASTRHFSELTEKLHMEVGKERDDRAVAVRNIHAILSDSADAARALTDLQIQSQKGEPIEEHVKRLAATEVSFQAIDQVMDTP